MSLKLVLEQTPLVYLVTCHFAANKAKNSGLFTERLKAASVPMLLHPQSAAQRRCSTLPDSVALPSTPNTNPQQSDTGDERSRQACKRGVPSRPASLSVCTADFQTVKTKRCRVPRGGRSQQEISISTLRRLRAREWEATPMAAVRAHRRRS